MEDLPDSEWVVPADTWPVGDPLPSDMVGRVLARSDDHWYYDTDREPADTDDIRP